MFTLTWSHLCKYCVDDVKNGLPIKDKLQLMVPTTGASFGLHGSAHKETKDFILLSGVGNYLA